MDEMERLATLSLKELQAEWVWTRGTEPPRVASAEFLRYALGWDAQAKRGWPVRQGEAQAEAACTGVCARPGPSTFGCNRTSARRGIGSGMAREAAPRPRPGRGLRVPQRTVP